MHAQNVQPEGPGAKAGLHSDTDFIYGADLVHHESKDLVTLIESHKGRPLTLFVYNAETDACREVTVTPNSAWGGEGR